MGKAAEERVLVIDDGGVGALVCCLQCPEPSRVTAWFPAGAPGAGAPAPEARRRAARRHADLLGLAQFVDSAVATPTGEGWSPTGPDDVVAVARLLLDGAVEALRQGCSRIVWPIHCGEDLDAMAAAVDEARLVSHVLGLAAPAKQGAGKGAAGGIRVETPLVDLTDFQLAELAHDLDAPLGAAWWCEVEGAAPCGRCGECRRWAGLLMRGPAPEKTAGGAARAFPMRG